jgi:hypothetical protein
MINIYLTPPGTRSSNARNSRGHGHGVEQKAIAHRVATGMVTVTVVPAVSITETRPDSIYRTDAENRRMVTHFCDTIGQGVQGRKISIQPPSGPKWGLRRGVWNRLFIQRYHRIGRHGAGRRGD